MSGARTETRARTSICKYKQDAEIFRQSVIMSLYRHIKTHGSFMHVYTYIYVYAYIICLCVCVREVSVAFTGYIWCQQVTRRTEE